MHQLQHMPLSFINLGPFSWPWFVLGIVAIIGLQLIAAFIHARRDHWREWYKGLPLHKRFGMMLLLRGTEILMKHRIDGSRPGVFLEQFNGRTWVSPDVEGFKLPDIRG